MDVEREVASFLAGKTGIKAVLEVPASRPDEFISVEMVGSSSDRFRSEVTLAIQSWAATRKRASQIASLVEEAVYGLDEIENLFNPGVGNTYRWPDPESDQKRYQTTTTVVVCE